MGAPVFLNVYDLASQNSVMYWCGIGIYHAGVEVYGVEYAYGGHDYNYSGVFATNPRDAPGEVIFRESIQMGETSFTPSEVQTLVQKLGEQYKGNTYHLLQKNCNHFANDLCIQLVNQSIPSWINRLAGLAVMLHCLLPTSWVPPLETPSAAAHIKSRGSVSSQGLSDRENLYHGIRSDHYRDPIVAKSSSSMNATIR